MPPTWSTCSAMGRLAEAWVAPPPLRELRELIRYRAKLVHLRTSLKAQVHAVLAKEGVRVPMSDLFGVGGQVLLDKVHLADAYRVRVESLRDLIDSVNRLPRRAARRPRHGVRHALLGLLVPRAAKVSHSQPHQDNEQDVTWRFDMGLCVYKGDHHHQRSHCGDEHTISD